MSEQRDELVRLRKKLPDGYSKIDRRYQNSKNFLIDQLRSSESVNDFRSVKQALFRSTEFSVAQRTFQFARVAVSARHDS